MTAAVQPRRSRPWLAPAIFGLVLLGAIALVLVLARRSGAPDLPPQPGAFQPSAPARPVVALDVQQAGGGRFTLSDGSRDVQLAPGTKVELLRAETAAGIQPGDWLEVIGIPNEVRNFAVRAIVVVSGGGAPDAEGVLLSPGGFGGHEAARDQRERPVLGGVVQRVDGNTVLLQGPLGSVQVTLTPNAPLRRLVAATPDDVHEGDRIAYHPAGSSGPASAGAVLVLPGGAR